MVILQEDDEEVHEISPTFIFMFHVDLKLKMQDYPLQSIYTCMPLPYDLMRT